ncbi:hypothetical protein HUJ04_002184 [Dendroctonus ponderosae]|uniref:PR domain zinc finger protein 10 n=1 Tax=Dendroctonus ponderosae TaxID=77166 RepID=A0AAR5PMH2_DENPD|nr:hypothetical protein HUJ04_002184 [Dendroctonus ponderosae]
MDCTSELKDLSGPDNQVSILENSDLNSTLVYIAVQYINKDKTEENVAIPTQEIANESFADFATPQVSPLDPNMGSVAPYSPVTVHYQEPNEPDLGPIIIHHYVTEDNPGQKPFAGGSLNDINSGLSAELCSGEDIQSADPEYSEIKTNNVEEVFVSDIDQKEVALLITDHETGISYSVNAQELLVEQCLKNYHQIFEAPSPDSTMETELFSAGDGVLKAQLDQPLDRPFTIPVNDEIISSYFGCLTSADDNYCEAGVSTRSRCPNIVDEEGLLSCVYSITDKPVLSRARASLPEPYLSIVQIENEDTVVAKKRIPKRTQFGPLKGALRAYESCNIQLNSFFMLVDGITFIVDVSDENTCNWMKFVRKALTYEEQNLILTQESNGLCFTATRSISPHEELKLGYSVGYAKQFNLEILKPAKKLWSCSECAEKFSTSDELQEHFTVHDIESEDGKKSKRKYRKVAQSKKPQINIVECNICGQMFNGNAGYTVLKYHITEKHKAESVKIGQQFSVVRCFQCTNCSMKFKLEMLLNIHKLEHDSELPLDQPNHVCPQCQRKFPTRKQLVLHVTSHAIAKITAKDHSVKCHICHKLFAHSIRLQKHMLCHGSDETKPLQCNVCKKRFLTVPALVFHEKVHMVGQKHFECPICKERFELVRKLKKHVLKHAHNNVYTCPHCKKTFAKYSVIRKHMKFHSERIHHCSECTKSFATVDNLKKHMLCHSDHREFLCADCGKQFKRKDKLAEHIKKLHLQPCNSRIPKVKPANGAAAKEPMDFHRFIYKCHSCLVGFKRRGMLVNHLANRHPDIKPDSVPELNLPILQTTKDYLCQYCGKVYKSNSKRKTHILKNHPGAALPLDNGQKSSTETGDQSASFPSSGTITTRPKNCQWCHRQYARRAKLLHHIRKAHPNKIIEEDIQQKENFEKCETVVVPTLVSAPLDKYCDGSRLLKVTSKEIENKFTINQFHPDFDKNQISTTDGNLTKITPAVIEGLMDEDSKYCHLSIVENEIIEGGELENNTHLYNLLTSSNGLIPPR